MTADSDPRAMQVKRTERKPWQPPAIVLERSLEVSAQGGPPQPGFGQGFLGPLGTSGGKGTCSIVT